MKKVITLCTLLIISLSSSHVIAKPESIATASDYEQVLATFINKEGPGVAVIVSQHGKVLYKAARGMANIEHQVPLKTDSVFRLGSITKQFTAAAIMMLAEQGKLSIKDDIHKYIPDFPTEGQTVTIENLLTHTSGIANYTEDENIWQNLLTTPTTLDDMLAVFAKHPMPLKTGTAMRYSNTGYVLLGKIIEVASNETYADFIEQHIFKKLAMKSSQYGGRQLIANRVSGYSQTDKGFENSGPVNMMWPHAAGSLLSTVDDLNTWFSALRDGSLISKASYQQMISPFILNDKNSSNYGFGLALFEVNKYEAIGHSGGIHGFATNAFYIPDVDLYVAVLNNNDSGNPGDLSMLLAAKALNIDIPEFKAVEVDVKKIKAMMGSYRVNEDSLRVLSFENGSIYAQRDDGRKWLIKAMSDNSFFYEESLSYFSIDKNKEGQQIMNFYSGLSTKANVAIRQK